MEARKRELKDFYRTVDPQREKNVEPIFSKFAFEEISSAVMKKYGKIPSGWAGMVMPQNSNPEPESESRANGSASQKSRPPLPSLSKKPDLDALRPSNGPPPMFGIDEVPAAPPRPPPAAPGELELLKSKDSQLNKYRAMQKAGLPQAQVENCLVRDGIHPSSLYGDSVSTISPKRSSRRRSSSRSSKRNSSGKSKSMKPKAPVPPPFLREKAPPPAAVLSSRPSSPRGDDYAQPSAPPSKRSSKRSSKRRSKSRSPARAPPVAPPRNVAAVPPPRPPKAAPARAPTPAPKPQPAASSGPTLERPSGNDPAYDKYKKMQKAGLPQGAVENAMIRDGMDPCGLFGQQVMTVPYTEPDGGGGGGRPDPPPEMSRTRAPVLSIAIKPQPPSSKPPKPKAPIKKPEMKAPPVSRPAPPARFDSSSNFSDKRNMFKTGANDNSEPPPQGGTQGRSKGPASSILARQKLMGGIFGGATAKPATERPPKGTGQKSSALLEKQKALGGLFGGGGNAAPKKEVKAFKWAVPTAESAAANAVAAQSAQGARPPNPMMGGSSSTAEPAKKWATPTAESAAANATAAQSSRPVNPMMAATSSAPVAAAPPAGPPPGGDAGTTYIEMWSDDYNHPYWFNPLTGESLWKKPAGWKPPAASGPVVYEATPPPPKQPTKQETRGRSSRKGRASQAKGRSSSATKGRRGSSQATKGRRSGRDKKIRAPKARPPPSRGQSMLGSYVMAAYDFEPADRSNKSEMTLTYGDVIKVTEQGMDGWWEGQRQSDRAVGLFPASYVVPWTQ